MRRMGSTPDGHDDIALEEPGDDDALPGFQSTAPEDVPPDEGDAGEEGAYGLR